MKNSITFLGDVWLPFAIDCIADIQGGYIFNLEGPITLSQVPFPGKINIKSEADHILTSFRRNPAAVCLANNHIMDYGQEGYSDTLATLRKDGIPFYGAGSIPENCNNPLILDMGETKIGLLGYVCPSTEPVWATHTAPGVMPLDVLKVRQDIQTAKSKEANIVVVSIHWGEEDVAIPKPEDVLSAHEIVLAGADVIIGHHAHCIQLYEKFNGRDIFYGLGNCIFPPLDSQAKRDGDGMSHERIPKKLFSWNKESLMVRYCLETGRTEIRKLRFENNLLFEKPGWHGKYTRGLHDIGSTQKKFRRSRFFSRIRSAICGFMIRPQFPKRRHLESIIEFMTEYGER